LVLGLGLGLRLGRGFYRLFPDSEKNADSGSLGSWPDPASTQVHNHEVIADSNTLLNG